MQPSILEGGAEILPCPVDVSSQTCAVVCLPLSADDGHIVYSTNTPTIEKLLRGAGVDAVRPDLKGPIRYRDEQSIVWLGPVLFFSAAALAANPHLISISLGVISNYLTEIFRGRPTAVDVSRPTPEVSLDIIQEVGPSKRYKRVRYKGTAEGLTALSASLKATYAEAPKSTGERDGQ